MLLLGLGKNSLINIHMLMKKLIFTLSVLFAVFAMIAQVDREVVILEGGTGVTCPYCPGAAMALHELYENGDPVAAIEYHDWGNSIFNTEESGPRCDYYAISSFPTMQFDGEWGQYQGGSATESLYSTYLPFVNSRIEEQASFTLELAGSSDGDDYDVVVTVEKVGEYSNSDLIVHLVLTESHIDYPWLNQSTVDFCQRDMYPNYQGTEITLEDIGDDVEVELSFTFNNSWDVNNCELIAFVQDNSNKYVLHGTAGMLTDLAPAGPDFTAGFSAEETDFCEPPSVAHFQSEIIGGEAIVWNWWFEGGITSSQGNEYSYEENPVVTYLSEGSYDVELIVYSNEGEWDTAYYEKYIGVHGLPEVYWDDTPELCNEDWAPYELVEGQPAGGVYSGDHIVDGMYFDSEGLEAGDYPVTYTFMDEFGCESYSEHMITVVSCVGLTEGKEIGLEVYPNPSTGLIYLNISANQVSNAGVKVVDALGKEVYSQDGLNISGSFSTTIDLTTQPQGMYFVLIDADEQRITRKIFVNH
jgi:PKD repeat protein